MVKEFKFEITFAIDILNFAKRILLDPIFQRNYQVALGDSDVSVSKWRTESNQEVNLETFAIEVGKPLLREVTYNEPLNAPSVVCKYLGTSVLGCIQKDTLYWRSEREIDSTSFSQFKSSSLQEMAEKKVEDMVLVTMQCTYVATEWHYTRVSVTICIDLKKTVWGFTNLIESGIEGFTKEALDKWAQMVDTNVQDFQSQQQEERQKVQSQTQEEESIGIPRKLSPILPSPVTQLQQQATPFSNKQETSMVNEHLLFAPEPVEQDNHSLLSSNRNSSGELSSQFFDVLSQDGVASGEKKASSPSSARFGGTKTPYSEMSRQQQHEQYNNINPDDDFDLKPINLSHLLTKSYHLAELKRQVTDTRAFVAKTELRVRALEQEYQDHQLEFVVNQYLSKVKKIYEEQHSLFVEVKAKAEQLGKQLQSYYDLQNVKRLLTRTKLVYFLSGSLFSCVFVVIPLFFWLYRRFYKRSPIFPLEQKK